MIGLDPESQRAGVIDALRAETLARGGVVVGRVIEGSMAPWLEIGDRIVVAGGASNPLALGTLVVFRREGRFVVHRALGTTRVGGRALVIERGDRNAFAALVAPESILGTVRAIEKPRGTARTDDARTGRVQRTLGWMALVAWRLRGAPISESGQDVAGTSAWGERAARVFQSAIVDPYARRAIARVFRSESTGTAEGH